MFTKFSFETSGKTLLLKHDDRSIKIELKSGVNKMVLFKATFVNIYVGFDRKIMGVRQFYYLSLSLLFRNLYILQLELNEYQKYDVKQWGVIKKRNRFIVNLYSMFYKLCKYNVKIVTNDDGGFFIVRRNIRLLVGVYEEKFVLCGKEFHSSKDVLNAIINLI
jgi:hypothetical protein